MHVTKHSNQNSPDHAECNDSDKYTVSTAASHLGYKWIYCCCTSITDRVELIKHLSRMNFHHKNNGNFNFKHHIHKNDSNMYTKKTNHW